MKKLWITRDEEPTDCEVWTIEPVWDEDDGCWLRPAGAEVQSFPDDPAHICSTNVLIGRELENGEKYGPVIILDEREN